MSRINAGLASITLSLDSNPFERVLNQQVALARAAGRELNAIGRNLTIAGAAAGFGVGVAVQRFAKFEDALLAFRGVTGALPDELAAIEQAALRAGRETSFTGLQVGEALVELARGGQSAQQAIKSLLPTLNLARGTATELGLATRLVVATLSQFELPASDAARVADALAIAANSSTQTVEDLGEALKFVGPVANSLNENLETVSAAIAVIAKAGTRGTLAGTQLKRIFLELSDSAKRLRLEEAFELKSLTDARGNLLPLIDILRVIGDRAQRLGTADRLDLFGDVFGRGSQAAIALSRAPQLIDEIISKIDGGAGSAARLARLMDSGVGGGIRLAVSAAEALGFALGDALSGDVTRALQGFRVGTIALEQFTRENENIARGAAAAVAGVTGLGVSLVGIGGASLAAGFAMQQFNRALSVAFLPLRLVGAALRGVTGAFSLALRAADGFLRATISGATALAESFGRVVSLVTQVGTSITSVGLNLLNAGVAVVSSLASAAALAVPAFAALVVLGPVVGSVLGVAAGAVRQVSDGFKALGAAAQNGVAAAGRVVANFGSEVGEAWEQVQGLASTLFAIGREAFPAIQQAVDAGAIDKAVNVLTSGLKLAFTEASSAFLSKFGDLVARMLEGVGSVFGEVIRQFSTIPSTLNVLFLKLERAAAAFEAALLFQRDVSTLGSPSQQDQDRALELARRDGQISVEIATAARNGQRQRERNAIADAITNATSVAAGAVRRTQNSLTDDRLDAARRAFDANRDAARAAAEQQEAANAERERARQQRLDAILKSTPFARGGGFPAAFDLGLSGLRVGANADGIAGVNDKLDDQLDQGAEQLTALQAIARNTSTDGFGGLPVGAA